MGRVLLNVLITTFLALLFHSEPSYSSEEKSFPDGSCLPYYSQNASQTFRKDCSNGTETEERGRWNYMSEICQLKTPNSCALLRLDIIICYANSNHMSTSWFDPKRKEKDTVKERLQELNPFRKSRTITKEKYREEYKREHYIMKALVGCKVIFDEMVGKNKQPKPDTEWKPIFDCVDKAFGCTTYKI